MNKEYHQYSYRNIHIYYAWQNGKKLKDLAKEYRITIERVRQIVCKETKRRGDYNGVAQVGRVKEYGLE